MNCHLCQTLSDAFREGKLPGDKETQVEAHLATCKECAESYKMQALAYRVINQEKDLLSNPFLITRIMEQIDYAENLNHQTIPVFNRVWRSAFITASLAAAIVGGVLIGNINKPVVTKYKIPLELALIDDATIESVNILSNE